MTRNDEGELVLVKKNEKDGMEITAVRSLKEGGKVLVMVSEGKGGREGGREGGRGTLAGLRRIFTRTTFHIKIETMRQELEGREGDTRGADF
jgi:hypothetical protein